MGARSRIADVLCDWVPATEIIRVAETVRRLFDRLGDRTNRNRARLRYVFDRIGVAAIYTPKDYAMDEIMKDIVRIVARAPRAPDDADVPRTAARRAGRR